MRHIRSLILAIALFCAGFVAFAPSASAQGGTPPAPTATVPPMPTAAPLGSTVIQPDVYTVQQEHVQLPTYKQEYAVAITEAMSPTASISVELRVSSGQVLVTDVNGLSKVKVGDVYRYEWFLDRGHGTNIDAVTPSTVTIDPNGAKFTLLAHGPNASSKAPYTLVIQRTVDESAQANTNNLAGADTVPTAASTLPNTAGQTSADPLAALSQTDNQTVPWDSHQKDEPVVLDSMTGILLLGLFTLLMAGGAVAFARWRR